MFSCPKTNETHKKHEFSPGSTREKILEFNSERLKIYGVYKKNQDKTRTENNIIFVYDSEAT